VAGGAVRRARWRRDWLTTAISLIGQLKVDLRHHRASAID